MKRTLILLTLLLGLTGLLPADAQRSDNYRGLLRDATVRVEHTNLPIVFINPGGRMIQRDRYILAKMKIVHNGDGHLNYADTVAHPGQHVDYEGWIALKYRGNSSFSESDKKPLALRTLESNVLPDYGGAKQKVALLGMPKDNKWCFIAPWCDQTMLRDVLSMELARPWFRWVPRMRLCEVFIDGTYYGVYLLSERVSKGKHRLGLDDPGTYEGDLTGDYHVAVDHGYDPYFASRYKPWQSLDGSRVAQQYDIKYEYEDPADEDFATLPAYTRQALQSEVNRMEAAFMADDWQQPDGGYRKQIDVQSFIDYMLATELSMNIDGYRLSTHLYKYSQHHAEALGTDSRWRTTLWDFNIAWGNANYYDGQQTDRWQYELNLNFPWDDCPVPFYWYRMLQDTAYTSAMKQRWQQYRQGNHSDERLMHTIDSLATLITSGGAAQRNEQAWGISDRSYIWPIPYYAEDYADAVNYLKTWTRRRLQFLDKHLLPPRRVETEPVEVAEGWNADIVAESLPAATYTSATVDGSDRAFYAALLRSRGGLPASRLITTENEHATFLLAPYDQPGALSLRSYGEQGTLRLALPIATHELFVLATSGNGQSTVNIRLNYADGTTTDAGMYDIRDWSVPTARLDGTEAVTALGNIWRGSNSYSSDNHYCLFSFSVPVDADRQLESLTVSSASTAYAAIMALAALKPAADLAGISSPAVREAPATGFSTPGIFSLSGTQLPAGRRPGLVIVRLADGSVRKVVRR